MLVEVRLAELAVLEVWLIEVWLGCWWADWVVEVWWLTKSRWKGHLTFEHKKKGSRVRQE